MAYRILTAEEAATLVFHGEVVGLQSGVDHIANVVLDSLRRSKLIPPSQSTGKTAPTSITSKAVPTSVKFLSSQFLYIDTPVNIR